MAVPESSVSADPSRTPLSKKKTAPTGTPFSAVTFADIVTLSCVGLSCGDNATDVCINAGDGVCTVIVAGADTLPANGPLALKAAVILWTPGVNEAVERDAAEFDANPKVPRIDAPS